MMDMDFESRMKDIFFEAGERICFYINYEGDIWDVYNRELAPECMLSDSADPITALERSGRIFKDDEKCFGIFSEKIKAGICEALPDKSASVCFGLIENDGRESRYEIGAFFSKTPEGKIGELAAYMHKLNVNEVKDRKILNYFILDYSPDIVTEAISNKIRGDLTHTYAFIQFDIVNFKLINEKYGEEMGDDLIYHILNVMRICCSENQPYTRLSSDLFMFITPYDDIADIYSFIRKLETSMSGYRDMNYAFAFGVYLVEDRSYPMRIMGDSAAIARKAAKGNAIENIGFFNMSQKSELHNRKTIEDRMQIALDNGEFVMYLQPKYNVISNSIVGAEALVRWQDPEKGLVPPNEFIPVLEENGFIVKIDEYMWECACRELRKLLDMHKKIVPISVNVSRVHFKSNDFIKKLEALLKKYGLSKKYLELEITESVDNINSNKMIKEAKESGFKLLMDDFGSGYSSLNTLRSTPFDVLKIDRSFFTSSMESERGQKIIFHTVAMSKDIGLDLIAEGVETKEQANFLHKCGCNSAQGFLYSRPVPIEEFEKLLAGADKKDK